MKFKNIQSRKDYLRLNELIGQTKGGVGESDGFANNAALKDTYLGALLNGMFKGLSWLWRKGKENFIINKLIARVINELLRGIIIYCFVNKINIQTGELSQESKNAQENSNVDSVGVVDNNQDVVGDVNKNETEDVEETVPNSQPEKKSEVKEEEVSFQKIKMEIGVDKVDNLLSGNDDPNLLKELGIVLPNKKSVVSNINQVADVIDSKDVDKVKSDTYEFLSKNMQFFDKIKKGVEDGDSDAKEKMDMLKSIYINYEISKKLKDRQIGDVEPDILKNTMKSSVESTKESLNINEAISKLKMNSEAGNLNKGISEVKGGTFINVGDILTKRDKEKHKDMEEYFKVPISKVNLAEIEKFVESKRDQKDVSKNVNPESMKAIQLTAKNLFVPKNEGDSNYITKLKLRWDKELSKTYANFSRIMDIGKDTVDIREDNYRSDLQPKVQKTADNEAGELRDEKKSQEIAEKFESGLSQNETTIKDLKGEWQYCVIKYNNNTYCSSIAPISKVSSNYGFYMFQITQTFTDIDNTTFSVTSDLIKFKKIFGTIQVPGISIKSSDMLNVYFMMKSGARLPSGETSRNNKGVSNSVIVFVHHLSQDLKTTNKLYMCEPTGSGFVAKVNLSDDDFDYSNTTKYAGKYRMSSCRRFESLDNKWWNSLNFSSDENSQKFTTFSHDRVPKFMNDIKLVEKLKNISKKF